MESLGALPNGGEWEFFGNFFATDELDHHHELLYTTPPQFIGQNSSSLFVDDDDDGLNNIGLIQSTFCSVVEASENDENMLFCSNLHYSISQESSYDSSEDTNNNVFIANQGLSYYPNHVVLGNDASNIESMDYFCMDDEKNHAYFDPSSMSEIVMKESVKFNNEDLGNDEKLEDSDHTTQMEPMVSQQFQIKRKLEDETENRSNKNQKKKPCVSKDVQQECKKNSRSRKNNQKVVASRNGSEAEGTYNGGGSENGKSSSSNISEDDYYNYNNAPQENSAGGTISSASESAINNSNGKPRASRGSATDPQSLYARKRRERINERLRILQNLVPNGTKVDISTMLEEAVNYVKFLQLQIKLLSSDDLWMYAPLAYNGLDLGLNLNMKNNSPTL